MKGLKAAWVHEAAFRQELMLAIVMLPVALWVDIRAIEAVVDRVGSEIHPLSGQAKDIASAAVFMSLALCGLTWLVVLAPLVF